MSCPCMQDMAFGIHVEQITTHWRTEEMCSRGTHAVRSTTPLIQSWVLDEEASFDLEVNQACVIALLQSALPFELVPRQEYGNMHQQSTNPSSKLVLMHLHALMRYQ